MTTAGVHDSSRRVFRDRREAGRVLTSARFVRYRTVPVTAVSTGDAMVAGVTVG